MQNQFTNSSTPEIHGFQDYTDTADGSYLQENLQEATKLIAQLTTSQFLFHSFMPINNLGHEGFRFEIPYEWLHRLTPIRIIPRQVGYPVPRLKGQKLNLIAGHGGSALPGANALGSIVVWQYPVESVEKALQAYKNDGMVCLKSIQANSDEDCNRARELFNILMPRPARELILQDLIEYLGGVNEYIEKPASVFEFGTAREAIERAYRDRAVSVSEAQKLEMLLGEILFSVKKAEERALNSSNGILVETRKARQEAAGGNNEAKGHYDNVDRWLIKQFPGFPMDTELEKANSQMLAAVKSIGQTTNQTSSQIDEEYINYLKERAKNAEEKTKELDERLQKTENLIADFINQQKSGDLSGDSKGTEAGENESQGNDSTSTVGDTLTSSTPQNQPPTADSESGQEFATASNQPPKSDKNTPPAAQNGKNRNK